MTTVALVVIALALLPVALGVALALGILAAGVLVLVLLIAAVIVRPMLVVSLLGVVAGTALILGASVALWEWYKPRRPGWWVDTATPAGTVLQREGPYRRREKADQKATLKMKAIASFGQSYAVTVRYDAGSARRRAS